MVHFFSRAKPAESEPVVLASFFWYNDELPRENVKQYRKEIRKQRAVNKVARRVNIALKQRLDAAISVNSAILFFSFRLL